MIGNLRSLTLCPEGRSRFWSSSAHAAARAWRNLVKHRTRLVWSANTHRFGKRAHTGTMPRRRRSCPSTCHRVLSDVLTLIASRAARGREPVSPETAGPLPGARGQAETARLGDPSHPRPALTAGRLAVHPHGRQARHADPLAPSGLAPVQAVAVAARTAANPEGLATTHRAYGPGESHLG